ncbi:MAG: hypothetical protein KAI84_14645 [Gammaproteobacteria bacterium]|nr:hypothetical protein [Gammaproteobacteria bacterium]
MTTFVFDFFNLYIPKGKKYMHKEMGIKIFPLKLAEHFESDRKNISSQYRYGGWKTAKCYIKSNNEKDAIKLATWLEFLYSFAQNRSVFFLRWYKYKDGEKYYSSQSKFIEHKENRFSDLVFGTLLGNARYTREINLFIDTALEILNKSDENKQKEILTTVHAYLSSQSKMPAELKFLIAWISLEKLANSHYNIKYKSSGQLFEKKERKEIIKTIEETLHSIICIEETLDSIMCEQRKKYNILTRNMKKKFLYEHDTHGKVSIYLDSLDLGFDRKELKSSIDKLIGIRIDLVHDLNSAELLKKPYINILNTINEQVILRLLGIDKSLEKQFLLHQFREPKKE